MSFWLGNPLLPLLLWVVLFLLAWSFRYNWSVTISSALIIALLALLLLPGGQKIAAQTAELPSVSERAVCLQDSLLSGTLWNNTPAPSCVYEGRALLP